MYTNYVSLTFIAVEAEVADAILVAREVCTTAGSRSSCFSSLCSTSTALIFTSVALGDVLAGDTGTVAFDVLLEDLREARTDGDGERKYGVLVARNISRRFVGPWNLRI